MKRSKKTKSCLLDRIHIIWTGDISFGQWGYIFRTGGIYHLDRIGQVFNFLGLTNSTRGLIYGCLKVCYRIGELLSN